MNWIDELLTKDIPHSNGSFSDHLYETGALLERWGADPAIVIAGRYHAIYSTSSFDFFLIPIDNREEVKSSLGAQAEFIIYCYCFLNYEWFWKYFDMIDCQSETICHDGKHFFMTLRDNVGQVRLSSSDIKAIGSIILANHVEQSARLPQYYQDDALILKLYSTLKDFLPKIPGVHRLKTFSGSEPQELILTLSKLFSWDTFLLNIEIQRDFARYCLDQLQDLLQRIDQTPLHEFPLEYLFAQLSGPMQEQCAISPKVVNMSIYKHSSFDNHDRRLVCDWLYRQASSAGLLPIDVVDSGITFCDDGIVNCNNRVIFPSPTFLHSIKLNFDDFYDVPMRAASPGEIRCVEGGGRLKTIRLLQASIDIIAELQPYITDFIKDNIAVLAVRKSDSEGFSSSSWPGYPGLVGLVNIDQAVSIERICSALVHETIHNFLYKIELRYPFTTDNSRLFGIEVTSLWTGRVISLSSYVHACCVWFGLYHFWKKYTQLKSPNKTSQNEYEKAAAGFKTPRYLQTLEEIKPYLRGDVFILLQTFYLQVSAEKEGIDREQNR